MKYPNCTIEFSDTCEDGSGIAEIIYHDYKDDYGFEVAVLRIYGDARIELEWENLWFAKNPLKEVSNAISKALKILHENYRKHLTN